MYQTEEGANMAKKNDLIQDVAEAGAELGRATIFFHEAMAEKFNLNSTDMKCMRFILKSDKPILAGDLAKHTGLTTGAVTGILDRLEKEKMISRFRDKADKRKVLVQASKDMAKKLSATYLPFSKLVSKVIQEFTDEELQIILRYKKRITEVLERETKKER